MIRSVTSALIAGTHSRHTLQETISFRVGVIRQIYDCVLSESVEVFDTSHSMHLALRHSQARVYLLSTLVLPAGDDTAAYFVIRDGCYSWLVGGLAPIATLKYYSSFPPVLVVSGSAPSTASISSTAILNPLSCMNTIEPLLSASKLIVTASPTFVIGRFVTGSNNSRLSGTANRLTSESIWVTNSSSVLWSLAKKLFLAKYSLPIRLLIAAFKSVFFMIAPRIQFHSVGTLPTYLPHTLSSYKSYSSPPSCRINAAMRSST